MRPEIETYLQTNGSRYTTKALRQQLIHAGYDPAEVDAALQETEAARAPQFAETTGTRRRFWLWVWGMNIAGLIVATIWAFQGRSATYAGAVPIVLGFFMLIGLAISGLIGRSMLARGTGVALIAPVIFTLILTGSCMAMFGLPSGLSTRSGTMELTIDPPLTFSGSGTVDCEIYSDYVILYANDLGSIGDRVVAVVIGTGAVDAPQGGALLGIDIVNQSSGEGSSYGQREFPMDGAANGVSGRVTFKGFVKQLSEPGPIADPDSISGTVSWTC
ncbi:MAG TPA: hypothetical protein VFJ00_02530 [Candidatus Limnocylindria bacterium]|nr:hypothetical protein [Candidatus Limnocylindria bacterium]